MIKIRMIKNHRGSDENEAGCTVGPNDYEAGKEYTVGPKLAQNLCSIGAAEVVRDDQPFRDESPAEENAKDPTREKKDLGAAPSNKSRGRK